MKLSPEMTAKVLELAGGAAAKPKRTRAPSVVVAPALPLWTVTLRPACRVISEANRRDHWAVAQKRAKAQKEAVAFAWIDAGLRPLAPLWQGYEWRLVVRLEHIGPKMDDDNLRRAFKAVRDQLAALIGVDDGDARVRWEYRQRTGAPGVRLTIEPGATK